MKTILKTIQHYDKRVSFYMLRFYHHHWLNQLMKFISSCGDFGIAWLIVVLITNVIMPTRSMSIHMLAALIATALIGQITIKTLVKRKRPCHLYPQVHLLVPTPNDSSFPSSHTASSFACSTVLFIFFPLIGIFGYIFAFLTGVSRIYLFVHFLSDVICGMILGISIGYIICLI